MEIIQRKPVQEKSLVTTTATKKVDGNSGGGGGIKGGISDVMARVGNWGRGVGNGMKTLFTKKRKFVILAAMFALLCVTGYLNFALNSQPTGGATIEANQHLFNMFRNTRADERARDITIYENMVGNANFSAQAQASAEARLFEIRANVAFEVAAEGFIKAEGYKDVIVNRSNGFVNVLIRKDQNIDRTQAIKIMSILQSIQPDLDIDNVFISIME